MIRVVIMDPKGKVLLPAEVPMAADLREVVEQARQLIRECENLTQVQKPKSQGGGGTPYLT